jgi:methionyl aminopeptidase
VKSNITIKTPQAFELMREAGRLLGVLFDKLPDVIKLGVTTQSIDIFIDEYLKQAGLASQTKGYRGYRHVSCISVNDELVHGVPSARRSIQTGDLVKVDVCASYQGYCADMARCFVVGDAAPVVHSVVKAANRALDEGISVIQPGVHLGDVSARIQKSIEESGYSVVRDFAGHGIGARMHEDPEILNYGKSGTGPVIKVGMAFALEPMLTVGKHDVYVERDGWTVKTVDRTLAAHVEDTVIVAEQGIEIITRSKHVG